MKRAALVLVSFAVAACAKGDKLGELDLRAAGASFPIDAARGDALHFRMDFTVVAPSLEGKQNRDAKQPIFDALKRSTLTIDVKDAAGTTRTTKCAAFNTGALNKSQSGNEMSKTGMPLDCGLNDLAAGRHTLTASVAWDPLLVAREAKLEVRREKRDTK